MSADLDDLYARHQDRLEDFWNRRKNWPRFEREFRVFGRRVRLASNQTEGLASADYSIPQYSVASPTDDAPFVIQLIVQPAPVPPGPAPDDLMRYIQYAGDGDWLAMQLGAWGHCQIDLRVGRALAVLTPELAGQPELVSRCLLNTILTNLFIAGGLGLLHATCLVRDARALLLMAPHNAGKSTTALRLALAGYALMSDSMVYVSPGPDGIQLLGFPVGRVKLRGDVLAEFPRLKPLLTPEPIRGETKHTLDLRRLDPALVYSSAVQSTAVDLCLLERREGHGTQWRPASRAEVMEAVMQSSLYFDTAAVWRRNLAAIDKLIARARLHHLLVGPGAGGIVQAVETLQGKS